ncbi:MAG: flagellar biosynthesis protein FlhB [Bdellovibrionaceae bacterium]|nr:flagellar biosynthesis protein FlhB [Pseudobdellovibrionaceae bacterium]
MADSDQGEKTEDPTQQRRDDFRKRGQVAHTKELASVLIIFTAILSIWMLSRFFLVQITEVFEMSFGNFVANKSESIAAPFIFAVKKTIFLVAPVCGIVWLVSFASSVLQIGFLSNEEAFKFSLERINPLSGLKRVFSLRSLVEGIKAVFKLIIVGSISYAVFKSEVFIIPKLVNYSVDQLLVYLGEMTLKLFGGVGFFMAVLAGIDYFFQRWDLEQKMKMTKQELKEEIKSREGDPLIKARIRRTQREMSQRRMMDKVPKADVIITNPTHIAVALSYTDLMVAPTIIAKGADRVAEKIKEIARENNIPIVENKPLARTIFKTLDIGQVIPKELYTAVAEVLSYIYKLKKKRKK